jgi:hypothetical protein
MNSSTATTYRFHWGDAVSLLLYIAMVTLLVLSLERTRRYALQDFATTAAQEQWSEWRDDVQKQSKKVGPVSRRTPKSTQPPTLVLLRDHYPVVLGGALLMSSLLFFVLVFFCRAIFSSPRSPTFLETAIPPR